MNILPTQMINVFENTIRTRDYRRGRSNFKEGSSISSLFVYKVSNIIKYGNTIRTSKIGIYKIQMMIKNVVFYV